MKDILTIAELLKSNYNLSIYGLTATEIKIVSNYLDQVNSSMMWNNLMSIPPYKIKNGYKNWTKEVNNILSDLIGVSTDNLTYFDWYGHWVDSAKPEEAVQAFLHMYCKDEDMVSDLLDMYPYLDDVM